MGVNSPGINLFANVGMLSDDLWATTGRVFYVGNVAVPGGVVGSDTSGAHGDSPQRPFSTLDYAIGQCVASRGDTIVVLPGHSETAVTPAIAVDIAGIRIIGLGNGRNRPAFNRSGAIDLIDVSVANVRIHNLRFLDTADTAGALFNVSAADCAVTNCVFEHSVGPLVAMTVASGADRLRVENCLFLGTAAGPDVAIDFESSASDNPIIRNCMFNYDASAGCDLGCIRANADTVQGGLIEGCTFLKMDTVAIDFNSSASVSDGIVRECRFLATAALTSIEDIVDTGGYLFFECYAHDGTNQTTAAARVPVGSVT